MKKILLKYPLAAILLISLLMSCNKEYISGGKIEDTGMYKNMLTYEVLQSEPLYDTLAQIIDAAGLKDQFNEQGTTFFAPSDYSIFRYLNERTLYVQATINQNAKFGLDSLIYYLKNNINGTKDSMLMYLINKPLPYDILTNTGALYSTRLTGKTAIVSYEFVRNGNLGYNPLVSSQPRLVYYTWLWYPYDLNDNNPAGSVPASIGVHTLCKTSGIITKNGIMNGLENSHTLFFYGTK